MTALATRHRPAGGGRASRGRQLRRLRVHGSVLVTGQTCSRDQRRGRYLRVSNAHPGKMLPSIARYLVTAYTQVGDLVVDPMAGIGTSLVEAVHLGRGAIGVEYEQRWARLAAANLEYATAHGATGHGHVVAGDARHLDDLLADEYVGRAALVLTSPPYGASTHGHVREGGARHDRIAKTNHAYGDGFDLGNLANGSLDQLGGGFATILAGAARLLRPGGHVAVTARPYRHRGVLVDIPGLVDAAAHTAGLRPVDRCVALICGIRAGRLVQRASFFQLRNARLAHACGDPQFLLQHELVLLYQPKLPKRRWTR